MSEENLELLDEEELDNLVYLSDEDGNEVAFEYLDSVEYEGEEYVVLISTDEDDDEVVILKVEPTPDDEPWRARRSRRRSLTSSRRETRIISISPTDILLDATKIRAACRVGRAARIFHVSGRNYSA